MNYAKQLPRQQLKQIKRQDEKLDKKRGRMENEIFQDCNIFCQMEVSNET